MSGSILLSEKHGVNPAVPICFFCGKEKNEIILAGKMSGDKEAPRNCVWNMDPCEACEEYMKQGVILISVKEEDSADSPHRTGGWIVVKDSCIAGLIENEEAREGILKRRMAFVPDIIWDEVGFPRTIES
jgi:hypothetical protein